MATETRPCCRTAPTGRNPARGDHGRLDPKVTDKLPLSLRTGEDVSLRGAVLKIRRAGQEWSIRTVVQQSQQTNSLNHQDTFVIQIIVDYQ